MEINEDFVRRVRTELLQRFADDPSLPIVVSEGGVEVTMAPDYRVQSVRLGPRGDAAIERAIAAAFNEAMQLVTRRKVERLDRIVKGSTSDEESA